jgi:hypothetical protein
MFIASYIWEIPFAQQTQGVTRKLLHGWQISGISSFQAGNPLTIALSGDLAGTGGGGQRPNVISPVEKLGALNAWFTKNSFAEPARGTFGNAGRSIVTGPGISNWDVSFSKRTDLKENVMLQFRAEFFNLFNHAQWSSVGTTYGTATFGQVTAARDPRITQFGLRLIF